jgi:ankyrin repeat protein
VLNICSSLVTVNIRRPSGYDYPDDHLPVSAQVPVQIIELAHYSVKEYLVSDRISAGRAARYSMRDDVCHDTITANCLGYLLQFQDPELKPDILQSFNLAHYSARFWPRHAKKVSEYTEATKETMIRLLCRNEPAYLNWTRMYDYSELGFPKHIDKVMDPLYYAALFGLKDVVKLLLDKGADVNAHFDGRCNSYALYTAASQNHKEVVELLLVKGATILDVSSAYEGPLHEASLWGYVEIVKLLLDMDTNDLATAKRLGAALHTASNRGHDAVVKLLLDKDNKGHITAQYYGLALKVASRVGHEEVVRLLLNKDTKGHITAQHYGLALEVAYSKGHEEVLKLLLDKLATLPAVAGHYTAEALRHNEEAIVQLLLDTGVVTPEKVLQARAKVVSESEDSG